MIYFVNIANKNLRIANTLTWPKDPDCMRHIQKIYVFKQVDFLGLVLLGALPQGLSFSKINGPSFLIVGFLLVVCLAWRRWTF